MPLQAPSCSHLIELPESLIVKRGDVPVQPPVQPSDDFEPEQLLLIQQSLVVQMNRDEENQLRRNRRLKKQGVN